MAMYDFLLGFPYKSIHGHLCIDGLIYGHGKLGGAYHFPSLVRLVFAFTLEYHVSDGNMPYIHTYISIYIHAYIYTDVYIYIYIQTDRHT